MSEVVIRCPNCGTTQSALAECEACHEARTRYFCTNHSPGRWLDGPACGECGARFGVDRVPRRPAPTPASPTPRRPRTEPASPLGRRVPSYDDPERTVDDAWTGPVRTPHRAEVEDIGVHDPRVEWPPAPPFPPVGVHVVRVGGCVRRLVILFVVLLVLAALAFFGLLGVGTRLLFGAEASVTIAQEPQLVRRATAGETAVAGTTLGTKPSIARGTTCSTCCVRTSATPPTRSSGVPCSRSSRSSRSPSASAPRRESSRSRTPCSCAPRLG